MSDEITISSTEEPVVPKQDDAAFAHGAAAGRYEAHMSASDERIRNLEYKLDELQRQSAEAKAQSNQAEATAIDAQITATTALIETVATEAESEAAAEGETTEDMPTGEITELEPPTIEVEHEAEAPKNKGFWGHLFG